MTRPELIDEVHKTLTELAHGDIDHDEARAQIVNAIDTLCNEIESVLESINKELKN